MRIKNRKTLMVALVATTLYGHAALAQLDPWNNYTALDGVSRCAIVNVANAELVVSSVTGEFILVSAADVILQNTFVDAQNRVFFEEQPFGSIGFAVDGDGLLSLWWLTLTGTVIEVDALTGVPSVTPATPAEFTDAGCDACDFWDDSSICEEPTITVPLCGVNVPITLPVIGLGIGAIGFVQRRGAGRGDGQGDGRSGR